MQDKLEDRKRTYGEIHQSLDIPAFKALSHDLKILCPADFSSEHLFDAHVEEARLDQFADLVNHELHEYLIKCRTQIAENPNKARRRSVNYANRIEELAHELRTALLEAPPAISNSDELQQLESELEKVPHILRELRQVDLEADSTLGIRNAAPRKERQLRNDLILGLHALYSEYSENDEWYTSNPNEDEERYSTPFFQILRLCYRAIGLKLSDNTIESDITKAKASGNLEDATNMSESLG